MTKNTMDKEPEARALYRAGKSLEFIKQKTGISKPTLIKMKTQYNWGLKGAALPELERVEEESLKAERERLGFTRARVEAKTVKLMDAKKTVYHQGIKVAKVEDNGTQLAATSLAADILGMRKPVEAEAIGAGIFAFYREQLAAKRAKK